MGRKGFGVGECKKGFSRRVENCGEGREVEFLFFKMVYFGGANGFLG